MTEDTIQMQREAARRVQRMQEHSRRVVGQRQGEPLAMGVPRVPGDRQAMVSPGLYGHPTDYRREPEEPCPPPSLPAEKQADRGGGPLAVLSALDSEQWLLLGLVLLLFRANARPELTLALLYLAM